MMISFLLDGVVGFPINVLLETTKIPSIAIACAVDHFPVIEDLKTFPSAIGVAREFGKERGRLRLGQGDRVRHGFFVPPDVKIAPKPVAIQTEISDGLFQQGGILSERVIHITQIVPSRLMDAVQPRRFGSRCCRQGGLCCLRGQSAACHQDHRRKPKDQVPAPKHVFCQHVRTSLGNFVT